MLLHLTDHSSETMHQQISRQLTERILAGDLQDGARLMAPRALARAQHVSVSTVERVYRELLKMELIVQDGTTSFAVAEMPLAKKQAIAMNLLRQDDSPLNLVRTMSDALLTAIDPTRVILAFFEQMQQNFYGKQFLLVLCERGSDRLLLHRIDQAPSQMRYFSADSFRKQLL